MRRILALSSPATKPLDKLWTEVFYYSTGVISIKASVRSEKGEPRRKP